MLSTLSSSQSSFVSIYYNILINFYHFKGYGTVLYGISFALFDPMTLKSKPACILAADDMISNNYDAKDSDNDEKTREKILSFIRLKKQLFDESLTGFSFNYS
jgi:hypothetical protein